MKTDFTAQVTINGKKESLIVFAHTMEAARKEVYEYYEKRNDWFGLEIKKIICNKPLTRNLKPATR